MNALFDPNKGLKEVLDRVRRIETRTTRMSHHFGIDTGAEKPKLIDGILHVSSRKVSLDELLLLVPSNMKGEIIDVQCGTDIIATLTVER